MVYVMCYTITIYRLYIYVYFYKRQYIQMYMYLYTTIYIRIYIYIHIYRKNRLAIMNTAIGLLCHFVRCETLVRYTGPARICIARKTLLGNRWACVPSGPLALVRKDVIAMFCLCQHIADLVAMGTCRYVV